MLATLLAGLLLSLAACSTTRTPGSLAREPAAEPAPVETPQIHMQPVPSPPPTVVVEPPAPVSPPPCVCSQPAAKPHTRPKARPKAAVREPEPQPAESEPAPTNGVVDAEVGRIGGPLRSILGKNVQSPKGEDLGRVVDLLADADGRVRVAIIDFGGFLGVGMRRIAVDWPLLHFDSAAKDKPLILSVTREKLQSAPEYKDSNDPKVLMPPAAVHDAAGAGTPK
jgi:hypothetical protein